MSRRSSWVALALFQVGLLGLAVLAFPATGRAALDEPDEVEEQPRPPQRTPAPPPTAPSARVEEGRVEAPPPAPRRETFVVAAPPASGGPGLAKPRKYSWELSPYVGARDYDAGMGGLSTHGIYGVRLGYNFTSHWELEANFAYDPNNTDTRDALGRRRENVDVENWDLNLLLNLNTGPDEHQKYGRWISGDRWIPFFTVGVGHLAADNDAGSFIGEREATMLNFGFGTRIMVGSVAGIRFDLRDYTSIEDDDFGTSFNNLEATIGATFIMGGPTLRDSDSDGVIDDWDKCPGTPLGCWVDEVGCPRDSDGDGVCDGLDRCPNTAAGCPVDQHGCPVDEDGDGVCDGLDDCPGTPAGCWVDAKGCPKDDDGDGVCNGVDRCPDTPKGAKVDATGCPLDADGDGVYDGLDQCPDTPKGTKVDAKGCPIEIVRLVLANVHFEFNKSDVRPFYRGVLDQVAASLLTNEWRTVEIELRGHTDAIDTVEYNYRLGQARADSVKDYLVSKGVAPARLVTKSFSELEPAAPNENADGSDDPAGRAMNRRVEMVPTTPGAESKTRVIKVLVRDGMFTRGGELTDAGRASLDEIASAFGSADDQAVRFQVTGNERGARAAASHLEGRGIARERIEVVVGPAGSAVTIVPQAPAR